MSAPTEAAHTVSGRRTIRVRAVVDRKGSSAPVPLEDFGEAVLRELWANEVAVFGNGRLDVDEHGRIAVLEFDALSWELVASPADQRPDPGEVWDRVLRSIRELTGFGWRVVSCR